MKKIATSLISIAIVSMMLFAIVPVMAKPNTISVSVSSGSSNSVVGYSVHVFKSGVYLISFIEHGRKATFDLSAYVVASGDHFDVRVYNLEGTMVGQNYINLDGHLSARLSMDVENT